MTNQMCQKCGHVKPKKCKKHRAVIRCIDRKNQEYQIVCAKCGKMASADDPWYSTLRFEE